MEILTSCNVASLSPYVPTAAQPWDVERVRHVTRRLGFGQNYAQEQIALGMTPSAFVEQLIADAEIMGNTPPATWANWVWTDYADFFMERNDQFRELWVTANGDNVNMGMKARLTLFWHNHFVTEYQGYQIPTYAYRYYTLLQTHALGNFKTFVREIGLNEAMLKYLNGEQNTKNAPNENYARELYELFTLGANNNYTQADITETARALTGWNSYTENLGDIIFNQYSSWDDQPKTIFNQTANFDYDGVIDNLFLHRADEIATFIVEKLYRYFVSPELPTNGIIGTLASSFKLDWEIAPLLRTLLKSEHFFDSYATATSIKSPLDVTHTFINEMNVPLDMDMNFLLYVSYGNSTIGQDYFNPVDVAGWQGDYNWINSSSLPARWSLMQYIMWTIWNWNEEHYRAFAIEVSSSTTDADQIVRDIIDRFFPKGLFTQNDYNTAANVFKDPVPANYFTDGTWTLSFPSVPWQTLLLIRHIFRMPEFQLK